MLKDSFNSRVYHTWLHYVGFKLYFAQWDIDWGFSRTKLGNITPATFYKRKDVQLFAAWVDSVPDLRDRQEQMVSAFLHNQNMYADDIRRMSDELKDFHKLRTGIARNPRILNYTVAADLDTLKDYCYDKQMLELLKPGQASPAILTDAASIGINLETVCFLDKVFNFTRFKTISPLWQVNRLKIAKYKHLLEFDNAVLLPKIDQILNQGH